MNAALAVRRVLSLLVLPLAAACGEEARMEVELPPGERLPGLRLHVDDALFTRIFTRADLEATESGRLTTGSFRVAERETIRIRLRLRDGETEVADGAVSIPASEDFRWNLSFSYATTDPTVNCLGCAGVVQISVAEAYRSSPDEALWAVWSGRPEGEDIVF